MRIKTENVKESLEPVGVDKASEEGTHGLGKMVALLRYCTEFLNPESGIADYRSNPSQYDQVSRGSN